MALTPEQVQLIRVTVPIIKKYGKDITSSFYKDMLTNHPELNGIVGLFGALPTFFRKVIGLLLPQRHIL